MALTDNLWRFRLSLQLAFLALVACVISFTLYTMAQNSLRTANARRYDSMQLAHELRQSSDDLTRMVRTYIVTGDGRYRDHYEEVAAIRDGRSPRPRDYENVYWDLVLDERRPSPMGAAEPLLKRMADAGFTREELNRLESAKAKSDRLIEIERRAISLVDAGRDLPEEIFQRNRLEALDLLHDAAYHRAKADIMRPIADAIHMVNERTANSVIALEGRIRLLLWLFVLASALLVGTLWMIRHSLRLVLGGSVQRLSEAVVNAVESATTETPPPHIEDADTIIGKLVEVQQHTVRAERQRLESERALSESERRFRSMADEMLEGICVVQDALIRFVNPKMSEILECVDTDLIDRPFIQVVHPDDRAELMQRYRNRGPDSDLDPSSEFHVNTGSGALRKIMTRAANFEWAGRPATLYFVHAA